MASNAQERPAGTATLATQLSREDHAALRALIKRGDRLKAEYELSAAKHNMERLELLDRIEREYGLSPADNLDPVTGKITRVG